MSYILDALRKSERERSLGNTPRITFTTVGDEKPRRPVWVWGLVAILGVAVGVLGAMQLSQWMNRPGADQPAPVATPAVAPTVVDETPLEQFVTAVDAPEKPAAKAIEPPPAPERRPVKVNTPRGPVEIDMPVAPPPSRSVAKKPQSAPVPEPEPEAEPAPASEKAVPRPRLTVPAPAELAEAYESGVNDVSGDEWEVTPEDEPYEEADVPASEAPLMTYYGLPATTRSSLGELTMNAHVYSSTPGRGFVMINGSRYREGDVLNEGASLEEIRQEGAVLEYRGQRFLLPVPR